MAVRYNVTAGPSFCRTHAVKSETVPRQTAAGQIKPKMQSDSPRVSAPRVAGVINQSSSTPRGVNVLRPEID